ncbi:uncharacterized protein LOC105193021 [Solenopsis invicta]|uniref:uncharacterized protein LOC105193021 n=1 Tax=Solenopsis invicta TaxID=13686 RepID=UPI000E33E927|nr:uncharacterized protein LOC105193021 [Solenopsis invicta]
MKEINEQADLSSSEDEAFTNSLREAIDQQFLHDDMYSAEKKVTQSVSKETMTNELDKNLKTNLRQEDKFMNFGVTPTFQSYIAKKLSEILERDIELESSETSNCHSKQKRKKDKSSGIKLLSTSTNLLIIKKKIREKKSENLEYERRFKRNRQIVQGMEDDKSLSKFREVAVDPEHILNKLDTEAWVNRRPEPEFKYKRLKNGTLVEI